MLDALKFTLTSTDPDSGAVQSLTTSHVPDGWDDVSITWERSLKYWGMTRAVSMPLKWTKDGALFLRDHFYNAGAGSEVNVTIQKLNKKTLTYSTVFSGKIDFSTFKDSDNYVEATIIDGGLSEIIKDNSATEYQIDYTVAFGNLIISPIDKSLISCISPYWVLWLLVDKMTGGKILSKEMAIASSILEEGGKWGEKLMLTTGKAWRCPSNLGDQSLPGDGITTFKTTFDDFFQSLNAITPIGIGVEWRDGKETLVLEDFDYFFGQSEIADLGEVTDLSVGFIKEMVIDKIEVKYPEKDYDTASQSTYEPNTYTNFRCKEHKCGSSTALSLESKYRADFAGIYVIVNERIADENDGWDEDIFWCEVERIGSSGSFNMTPGAVFLDPIFPGQKYYNCLLTPHRNLKRNMKLLCDYFYELGSKHLIYTAGGYNNKLIYSTTQSDGGISLQEAGDVYIDYPVTFKPLEISFSAPYDAQFAGLVNTLHDHYVKFWHNGSELWGYFKKMEVKLYGRGSTKFTLICHLMTPMERLIR